MTIRSYIHSSRKRAKAVALVESGATENFMNLNYARWLGLPIKNLVAPRKVYNVDGTQNLGGDLQHYTNVQVQTGTQRTNMRFFLTNLGEHKMILGYPWFAATQPKIDWSWGWIDHSQLPIILRSPDAAKARFVPRGQKGHTQEQEQTFIAQVEWAPPPRKKEPNEASPLVPSILAKYQRHNRVFSEQASQRFPEPRIWDHAIKLKPDAPATILGKVYALTQTEQEELRKFILEHMKKGYIQLSKSPYAAPFFFIKKKDRKLRPVQDY
jgi:hypothetical protein